VSTTGTPGDVDDGVVRSRLDNRFQQVLHHHLRARAIQSSDERQRQDVLPEPYHGRGKLQQFFLLAQDHFFARLLERFRRQQPEFVHKKRGEPGFIRQRLWDRAELILQG
jgi:hypothetical protein